MTAAGWAQLIALIALVGVTAPLLGRYMATVYEGGPSRLDRVFGPVERLIYRTCRIDPQRERIKVARHNLNQTVIDVGLEIVATHTITPAF